MGDSIPRNQRSYFDLLQDYWDHPHPQGLVAMVKAALNGVADATNGSAVATGAYPFTEEEAFRYNQVRDRGITGAFDAASSFSPLFQRGPEDFLRGPFRMLRERSCHRCRRARFEMGSDAKAGVGERNST